MYRTIICQAALFCSIILMENELMARGEHRIQVQNFGRKNPEIPTHIMQANYYNEHHPEYMIRTEDLNETLNEQINEEIQREYDQWFDEAFHQRLSEYEEAKAIEEYYQSQESDQSGQSGDSSEQSSSSEE